MKLRLVLRPNLGIMVTTASEVNDLDPLAVFTTYAMCSMLYV